VPKEWAEGDRWKEIPSFGEKFMWAVQGHFLASKPEIIDQAVIGTKDFLKVGNSPLITRDVHDVTDIPTNIFPAASKNQDLVDVVRITIQRMVGAASIAEPPEWVRYARDNGQKPEEELYEFVDRVSKYGRECVRREVFGLVDDGKGNQILGNEKKYSPDSAWGKYQKIKKTTDEPSSNRGFLVEDGDEKKQKPIKKLWAMVMCLKSWP